MVESASRAQRLLVGALLGLSALVAGMAVRDRRQADLREVTMNVDFLRGLVLSLEDSRGQAPMPCGYEAWAWEALVAQSDSLGDCGDEPRVRTTASAGGGRGATIRPPWVGPRAEHSNDPLSRF